MTVAVGSEVDGIRLRSIIGHGGMAIVYLGEREASGEQVVVKVLREESARDEQIRRRFTRESRYASSLDHPHIVRAQGAGEADGFPYIVMQYVRGTDLRARLATGGPLHPGETIAILEQIAGALDVAHRAGLLHRDVKPGNVLIASGDGPEPAGYCYLTDFGLSKQPGRDSRGLTAPSDFVGSVLYTAPEEMLGGDTGAAVDVYSLGCVLYECLVGKPPFEGVRAIELMQAHIEAAPPKPSKQRPGLPTELDRVVQRVLAKRPGDRYASCGELVQAAREAFGGIAAPRPQPTTLRRVSLRLELDFRAGEASLQLDDGPASVRVTGERARWHLAGG